VVLIFTLPTGAYATSVLRELCHYGEAGPLAGLTV
jgi:tRNA(Glu) U13 pseudouridine synthase TruD